MAHAPDHDAVKAEPNLTPLLDLVLQLLMFFVMTVNFVSSEVRNDIKLPVEFHPRGSTPLLDALGQTIVATGARLRAMPESDRPGRVIFVAITDGLENASQEYSKREIRQMIQHQESVYKWDFVYLGANVDAFAESEAMGFASHKAGSFQPALMRQALGASAQMINDLRGAVFGGDFDAELGLSETAREAMDPGSAEEFKKRTRP